MTPIETPPNASAEMAAAEKLIRKCVSKESQGRQAQALLEAYWETPAEKKDAFVAVLAARATMRSDAQS